MDSSEQEQRIGFDASEIADQKFNRALELFARNYGYLLDVALESRQLLNADAELLIAKLIYYFSEFAGDSDEQFCEWAEGILQPAAERFGFFYTLLAAHEKIIHAAIWAVLGQNNQANHFDDDAALESEIFQDVCLKVMAKIDGLMLPGKAKLSTRIYELAKWEARSVLKRQRGRYTAVSRRLASGRGFIDCETLSDSEIAEQKAMEMEKAA